MAILLFIIAHWYGSLFIQTFFHHRYAAHQMFTMSKGWEKTFTILSFFAMGASYLSARVYGILHRLHHAYADTENDPHSPKYDANPFAMMWRTKNIYHDILRDNMEIEERFTKDLPSFPSWERIADSWPVRLSWVAIYTAFYFFFATEWWMWMFLPIHYVMGPFHGLIINWFAHKVGYVNFKVDNTSTNLMAWDIFMLGEGYHNNHHKFSGRPNFAVKWFEFDPVYPFIALFNWLGIIKLKTVSKEVEIPAVSEKISA
ncbi:MAG: acyl-CoA desaturase [Bacteroidetes bacterium]|nr:acyl-CoA desaturase [Bacteroidota bacterium]